MELTSFGYHSIPGYSFLMLLLLFPQVRQTLEISHVDTLAKYLCCPLSKPHPVHISPQPQGLAVTSFVVIISHFRKAIASAKSALA